MMPRPHLLVLSCLALVLPAGTLVGQAARVILVRHAEKVDDSRDPQLSTAGMARAMALAAMLDTVAIDAIVVSQFRRTQMTAAPTATAHGVTPTVVATTGTPATYADTLAARIRAMPAGHVILVVGHSNTLTPLIARLGGPPLPDLCDGEYAQRFDLELGPPTVLQRATYGAEDSPAAAACMGGMARPPSGEPPAMPQSVTLRDLVGEWDGANKLWLMPGAPVRESVTTARVDLAAGDRYLVLRYTWVEGGKPQDGVMIVRLAPDSHEADIAWTDSWHQGAYLMRLAGTEKSATTVSALGSYPAPNGPDWGWRIAVNAESPDRFVLRMWNIKPGGPEVLAVEAVYTRP